MAFIIQWAAYVPSLLANEKFYDLTGSFTYTVVTLTALIVTSRFDVRSWCLRLWF